MLMCMPPDYALAAITVRASHPAAPALDVLDLVLRGRQLAPLNSAAEWLAPATPFGQIIAEAFDHAMTPAEWAAWTSDVADPSLRVALHGIWALYILPRFAARYGTSLAP